MGDPIFTDEHHAEAENSRSLGPAYFAARETAQKFMAAFEAENFKPLIDDFARDFQQRLWDDLETSLLSDTECNLQLHMSRMVDDTVQALLGGNEWALRRYVLGDKHDCEKVRAVVAAYVPTELQDRRIAELEAQVASLQADLQNARRY